MFRKTLVAALAVASLAVAQDRGAKRGRIDVQNYSIDAEVNPRTQALTATVKVRFVALDSDVFSLSFELNNALGISRVVDESGRQIQTSRSSEENAVRVNLPAPLAKGTPSSLTFSYDGRLTGQEESPVSGIRFASIQNDFAYLMYPARWFPVNDYTADRYTADLRITVPSGFKVISGGIEHNEKVGADKTAFSFQYGKPSFPGSIAIVQGDPVRVDSQGVNTSIYFRKRQNMANAYGDETGKIMSYFTGLYGLPPQANLTLIETEDGTPNGYSAPGVIFLSPRGIGSSVASRLLANQISRQWWETLLSPISRDHMWLENGNARFAELLWEEHTNGPGAFEQDIHDNYVEALTVDNPPLIQTSRLEDYSPEWWATTAGKGAAILNMLRNILGADGFAKLMSSFPADHGWQSVSTADFRKAAEQIYGQSLQYFFVQWIESNGAPEFKTEYTIFRRGTQGFRVMGKISQDLDTFHMPVDIKIETEGNPETKRVDVVGTSSEFSIDTFGKPKSVTIDPAGSVLRWSSTMRSEVAIKRGEQFVAIGELGDALKEYQKAIEVNRNSSLAHYRVGEIFFLQNNFQSAANEYRQALNGDLTPKWTEVWCHIKLGNVFDVSGQRDRAVNEYNQAIRTRDNTSGAQEEAAKLLKTPYERKHGNI
ncbi:MAG TPA: tetratricopeptide repeat protein [Bryobacteraceae bacterium]|nr:tetratricopeptide repeat protein [Bryobacteraceae bacterium]